MSVVTPPLLSTEVCPFSEADGCPASLHLGKTVLLPLLLWPLQLPPLHDLLAPL